jgi:serine/threonine protein kinase/tetratricopeptide (TPR) repeat protein
MTKVIEPPELRNRPSPTEMLGGRDKYGIVLDGWQAGGEPDTLAALRQFPELQLEKNLIVNLAYEEFVLRQMRGESLDPNEFSARFAGHRSSVLRLLDAHDFLDSQLPTLEQAPPTKWPEPGELLADYRVQKLLGRGGFARVYLALQVITGKQMVLKIAPPNPREPKLLGGLDHPNVVPIHDARYLRGGMSVLVMPHLGNSTLVDLLDAAFPHVGAIPSTGGLVARAAQRYRTADAAVPKPTHRDYAGDVLALATELARGLAYLHSKGVVHRDLKPTNVLLSWTGKPVILDFNLAEGREDALQRGAGTLYYMAPELIEAALCPAEGANCDGRADLFSYGVIVYELLTGRHPFSMPDASESAIRRSPNVEFAQWLLGQHRSGCMPIRTYVPDIDPAVERLVLDCLAFDPSARPKSADAIVRELERIQGFGHRLGRWLRRWRKPVAIAACAGGLLLAGTAYGLSARPPYVMRTMERARAALANGQASRAADDLDEVLLIEPGNTEARFLRGMARVRLNEFDFAAEDFGKVWEQARDDNARVMLAYCMAARDLHDGAIYHIDGAMPTFANKAALLNNRAFSNYRLLGKGDNAARRLAIRNDLNDCLKLNSNMAAAYLNRGELEYHEFQNNKDVVFLDNAIKDIDHVMELGLVTSDTCYDAALFRVSHPERQREREQTLAYLRQAQERGRDLTRVAKKNSKFAVLFREPDFAALLETPLTPNPSQRPPDGLADPLFSNFP